MVGEVGHRLRWALKLLVSLTAPGTSPDFEQHGEDIDKLQAYIQDMCTTPVADEALRGEPGKLLVEQLTIATVLAMERAAEHSKSNEWKAALVHSMVSLFQTLMEFIHHLARLQGWSQECTLRFACMCDELGFLTAFTGTALGLHAAIECGNSNTACLAVNAASTEKFLVASELVLGAWLQNETMFDGSRMSPAAAALCKLAVAYMRFCGSSESNEGTNMQRVNNANLVCYLTDTLRAVVIKEVIIAHRTDPISKIESAVLAESLTSGDLLVLLLAQVACMAKVMHARQQGKSTATMAGALRSRGFVGQHKHGLPIPAFHNQVLQLLGIGEHLTVSDAYVSGDHKSTKFVPDEGANVSQKFNNMICEAHIVASVLLYKATSQPSMSESSKAARLAALLSEATTAAALATTAGVQTLTAGQLSSAAGNSSSASAATCNRLKFIKLATAVAVTAPEVAKLLANPALLIESLCLLLVELQLLAPTAQLIHKSLDSIKYLLHLPEGYGASPAAADAVYMKLIEPMLHLSGPAALFACKDLDAAATEDALRPLNIICQLPNFAFMYGEGMVQVLAAYKTNPLSSCAVMEAALRLLTTSASTSNVDYNQQAVGFGHVCAWLCDPSSTDYTSHCGTSAADQDNQWQLAVQQFALLVSVLKVVGIAAQSEPSHRWSALQVAGQVVHAAISQAQTALTNLHVRGSEKQQRQNRDITTAWLVLLAQSCRQLASLLLQKVPTTEPGHAIMPSMLAVGCRLFTPCQLVASCSEALAVMRKGLLQYYVLMVPQKGTSNVDKQQAESQQLLRDASDLCQALEQLESELDDRFEEAHEKHHMCEWKAAWYFFISAFGQNVLQQLVKTAQRVISLLPMPNCCNNPSCSNIVGISELKLTYSKGSVCGGCKRARYCGKECQRQHWKLERGHKAICKCLQALQSL